MRLILTLDESFQASRRVSADITVRSGFDAEGRLVFEDIRSDYMLGAYADIAERVVAKSQYTAAGPYRVPNVRITARSILSNTTPACAFRGFGTPQVNWAVESNIDAAARALGIDRAEIRLAQSRHPGRGSHQGRHASRRALAAGRPDRHGRHRLGHAHA